MGEMVERVAYAMMQRCELTGTKEQFVAAARAAIQAIPAAHTLEMQVAGMEALCLYNIEKDGPAKPHDECRTPDDWMMRGANIAGRMQSGEGVSRVLNAMLSAALSEPQPQEGE